MWVLIQDIPGTLYCSAKLVAEQREPLSDLIPIYYCSKNSTVFSLHAGSASQIDRGLAALHKHSVWLEGHPKQFYFTSRHRLFWAVFADVMPLASPKPCSRFIAFFQVAPFQFKVEAIPTEKKVRVRTPDFWPVKRPHSSGSENERQTSLDVLPLHALFLRWHNCRGKIVSTLGNNDDYGILKFQCVPVRFDVPILRAYYVLRMPSGVTCYTAKRAPLTIKKLYAGNIAPLAALSEAKCLVLKAVGIMLWARPHLRVDSFTQKFDARRNDPTGASRKLKTDEIWPASIEWKHWEAKRSESQNQSGVY